MRKLLVASVMLCLSACATASAVEQTAPCAWGAGAWRTYWATPNAGDGPGEAPLSLLVTPGGAVSGTWGEPAAGEVWGEAVGPDGATIVGQWSASMDRAPQGAFLLHLMTGVPDEHGLCRFEGVYTTTNGQAPLGWFGERAAD